MQTHSHTHPYTHTQTEMLYSEMLRQGGGVYVHTLIFRINMKYGTYTHNLLHLAPTYIYI